MLNFLGPTRVCLAVGATDLRKSFDTLAGVVRNSLRLDPLSGHLFAFTNSRRNRLKILFWDRNGWWLCSKRLESGTLSWPTSECPSVELSPEELTLLVSGIDLSRTQRRKWLDRRPKSADENSTESPWTPGLLALHLLLFRAWPAPPFQPRLPSRKPSRCWGC